MTIVEHLPGNPWKQFDPAEIFHVDGQPTNWLDPIRDPRASRNPFRKKRSVVLAAKADAIHDIRRANNGNCRQVGAFLFDGKAHSRTVPSGFGFVRSENGSEQLQGVSMGEGLNYCQFLMGCMVGSRLIVPVGVQMVATEVGRTRLETEYGAVPHI
jgi:hypothetical protein